MTKNNQFRKKLFTYTNNSFYIHYSLFCEFVYSSFDYNKTFLLVLRIIILNLLGLSLIYISFIMIIKKEKKLGKY